MKLNNKNHAASNNNEKSSNQKNNKQSIDRYRSNNSQVSKGGREGASSVERRYNSLERYLQSQSIGSIKNKTNNYNNKDYEK